MCSLLLAWSKTEDEAISWFKTEAIPACGGNTPIELCKNGDSESLLKYVRHIDKGGFQQVHFFAPTLYYPLLKKIVKGSKRMIKQPHIEYQTLQPWQLAAISEHFASTQQDRTFPWF